MRIKNSKLLILSIVAAFAVNNASYTAARELLFSSNIMTSKPSLTEKIKSNKESKDEKGRYENPYSEKLTISKLETIYELNGLQYNSIFGLLLDFSEGKVSIENLEQEMINKVKACKKKERELLGNIEESSEIKIYAEEITGMWELYAKIVSIDKKNLQEQKTSLAKLRERYAQLAAGWFSNEYGMKGKEGVAKIKLEQVKESAQNKDTNSTSLIAQSDFERAKLRFDYAEN